MAKKDFTTPLSLNGLYPNLDDRYTNNGDPYVSKNAAETALASKLNAYHIGLTVLVKESGWTEAKEYWVQPKGTTPETYGLVEKGAGVTDYNDLENKPTISDGGQGSPQLPIAGNIKVTASAATSGQTTGVTVTAGQNGVVNVAFTLEKGADGAGGADGGDAYEVYKSTVPSGQTPMSKTEWLASLKGADGQNGVPGHNPCLGRFAAVPNPMPMGQVGDYLYVDTTTTDPTTQEETTTTTVYHYGSNGWDNGTVINADNPTFASSQEVTSVAIKDLDGDNDPNAVGVLSAVAGPVVKENNSAREDLAEKTPEVLHESKNYLNKDDGDIVSGYIVANGTIQSNQSYKVTGYIVAKYGETYHNVRINSQNTGIENYTGFIYGINEYDATKTRIRTVYPSNPSVTRFTYTPTDESVKYFRFTSNGLGQRQFVYIESDYPTPPTSFVAYFEPYTTGGNYVLKDNSVSTNNIQDSSITQDKLAEGVTLPPRPNKFNGWSNSGEVSVGQNLKIDRYFRCRKGFVASALIGGVIDSVRMHIGNWYLDIDQTNLSVSPVTGSTMLVYPHGLQLGQLTTVLVDMGNGVNPGGETAIKIIDADGNVFTKTSIDFRWSYGYVQLDNNNTAGSISVSLSAFNKNLPKKIWLFGDSYLSYGDPAKWITKMFEWGYSNLLLNQMGGETSSQALNDLNVLLESEAKPSYIVWCLGMNDGSDSSNGQPSSSWSSVIEQVINICLTNGIELILATIPSTPNIRHTYKSEYVRNSGYRYIDFAAAVEDGVGVYPNYWRLWGGDTSSPASGSLLSSDKVHPTVYGAVELASRVLVDFPEITVIG